MLKMIVAAVTGLAVSGNVYMAGWHSSTSETAECCVVTEAMTTPVHSNAVDMKNTKCIVRKEDIGGSTTTVEYQGKAYHICCSDCVADFNKDPEKFVKALQASPLSYGIKQ